MVLIDWILELSPLHWQNTETHSYPALPEGGLTSDLWHSRAQSLPFVPVVMLLKPDPGTHRA